MSFFQNQLDAINPAAGSGRRWVYVPYDQLTDDVGPLATLPPQQVGIVLVESEWWMRRRPYHRQKLALLMLNQRAFALEQAQRGVAVRYLVTRDSHRAALERELRESGGSAIVMEPAERELRVELEPLVREGLLEMVRHEGWLTTREDFHQGTGMAPPFRMDAFYRHVRQRTGYLMENGKPLGGKYSHDHDNREAWSGNPSAPETPRFAMDALRDEVATLIEREYHQHPGRLDVEALPATASDAEQWWAWAKEACLPHFGPYEDAMSTASRGLFHTRLSPLINIHRLLPRRIVEESLTLAIPLNSKEGFLRQMIGWREFVRHIHDATDGFRSLDRRRVSVMEHAGDGGWGNWLGREWPRPDPLPGLDGGAMSNAFEATEPLPAAFWNGCSGMNCLDTVVQSVWDEGWSHHITRLMVVSNIATLLEYSPRDLTDWFWVGYIDAYDWVVEPNVLGMSTHSAGDVMTTKPYIAGSAYINKMSDYCQECRFSPNGDCPIKRLYWAFLDRHENQLAGNMRLRQIMAALRKRSARDREMDRTVFEITQQRLRAGEELRPADYPA
ncbi:deoxyribodipyrimidine photolyase [bacterium]|nr:deoxyribodipyrimidine photolyase [bacterium]